MKILDDIRRINIYIWKYLLFIVLFFLVDLGVSQFLKIGLYKYYGLNIPSKIVLIGHSHTMLGLDKQLIEKNLNCNVAKYAIEGANGVDRLAMLKHFLHQNGDSVKILVYDVDAYFLTSAGLSKNSYVLFYPFMDDPYIKEYIKSEVTNKFEFFIKNWIRTTRFTDLNLNGSLRGHLGFYSNLKIGIIDTIAYKNRIADNDYLKITFDKPLQEKFEEMLKLVSENNIKLILLGIPTVDILNRTDSESFNKAMNMLNDYSRKFKNVYFLNYNDEFAKRYELFYDPVHLNPKGNKVVTERLIQDLKIISLE
jgi:hypothetical protein